MNNFVIDASFAVKWLLWEDGTDKALEVLDRLLWFYAPDLFLMEIDAVLTKKVRKRELDAAEALIKYEQARTLPFKLISYSKIDRFAIQLATEFSITLYDATYLATAIDYDAVLYTADRKLVSGLSSTPFAKYAKYIWE
ncbi:MAG TPA: type II toxin-antitoxin system VapC family toxin [Bacteroidales bacterium]|nr:type II toxin-antitoxin system VapC family toxin [Bacteroidales bacterium]